MENNKPTTEQIEALAAYAASHGRAWKYQLNHDWMTGQCSGPLQQVRNQFGPSWLVRFKLPKLVNVTERYVVINLDTDESHGEYDTLDEARGCVRYDHLRAYSIWLEVDGERDARLDHCDPYEGDDDRAKQALGMPNASER